MAGEWTEVPLGDVITLQRGFDLSSQNRKPGKVPIVSSSGISDYHSEVGVKGPGVVTGGYGATAGQVSFTSSRLTTNQAVCALIPKKDFAFFNYLTMRGATAELENKAVGSAQQNISKGIVEETKLEATVAESAAVQTRKPVP